MTFWNIFWIVLGAFGLIVIAACIFFVFAACRVSGKVDQATEKRIDKSEE